MRSSFQVQRPDGIVAVCENDLAEAERPPGLQPFVGVCRRVLKRLSGAAVTSPVVSPEEATRQRRALLLQDLQALRRDGYLSGPESSGAR